MADGIPCRGGERCELAMVTDTHTANPSQSGRTPNMLQGCMRSDSMGLHTVMLQLQTVHFDEVEYFN